MLILAAVVVDYEYMATHRQNIMAHFEKILSDTIRENMKNGGINVRYFTWNSIKIKKGTMKKVRVYIYNYSQIPCRFSCCHYRGRL